MISHSEWLTCSARPSGATNAIPVAAWSNALAPGPRADLRAIRDRYAHDVNPRVSAAGWRIYDVLIEGVSFVANYRAQFDELIQKGGAVAAIRTLEAKLAQPVPSNS